MNWNELVESVDQWHDHETVPLDGTPVLIDQGGVLGVYAWETRPEVLGNSFFGKPMQPTWIGFAILTELTPAISGGRPLGDRFLWCQGVDEPLKWRPLPARFTGRQNGRQALLASLN